MPIGVEVVHHNADRIRSHARVWAPDRTSVVLVTDDGSAFPLERDDAGYFAGELDGVGAGTRYRFRVDDGEAFPDPVSRFQPDGPHGSSMIVDATTYPWSDGDWRGVSIDGQVIYELHLGTFTKGGTFRAAIDRLPDLVDVGVTVIELMPIAEFAGQFGWGYDGVALFAPYHRYGTPDDLRALVDAAHRLELGVILDVVYNHFGPDGNYTGKYAARYVSGNPTEWGDALNFDGDDAAPVREFFISNARYWIEEFHLDGLRLDATQQIFDTSSSHIVADVAAAVREAAKGRRTIVVGENEPQSAQLIRPRDAGGYQLDGLWNDDFHHAARVAATGRNEAYYDGYRGSAQELLSTMKYGFLYQGEWYAWQKNRRGSPSLDIAPQSFVQFLQNHDQVANSAKGQRINQESSAGRCRALTALLLLAPQTPMLFQGQEFAASAPFLYFADHEPTLAALVRTGRAKFVSQFPSIAAREEHERIDEPSDPWTFLRCKLDWAERRRHKPTLDLHRDLLKLRREDPVIRNVKRRGLDGAVINEHAFVARWFGVEGDDRMLVVNLGARIHADPLAEPLVAPATIGGAWKTIFSTESPKYGGWGAPEIQTKDDGWWIPAESATLLSPVAAP
ncbi:MAG TPA: malto-oligosyltrehalose trehalohydrolase [Gemmatimonadaceae bacterium]|nr:malto-oligosyltrehalose trehalohydrolase [Gemmatimonadaceae bacterium]